MFACIPCSAKILCTSLPASARHSLLYTALMPFNRCIMLCCCTELSLSLHYQSSASKTLQHCLTAIFNTIHCIDAQDYVVHSTNIRIHKHVLSSLFVSEQILTDSRTNRPSRPVLTHPSLSSPTRPCPTCPHPPVPVLPSMSFLSYLAEL